MKHEELTRKIIACAYTVYNKLGFGFLESVYKKAMMIELARMGLKAEEEKPLTVYYDDEYIVGEFSADILVEDEVIVELKSVQQLAVGHELQVVNYLNAVKLDVGLLLNFGPKSVDVKRKYRNSTFTHGGLIFRQKTSMTASYGRTACKTPFSTWWPRAVRTAACSGSGSSSMRVGFRLPLCQHRQLARLRMDCIALSGVQSTPARFSQSVSNRR
jgi:GxxExxY protein